MPLVMWKTWHEINRYQADNIPQILIVNEISKIICLFWTKGSKLLDASLQERH